MSEEVPEKAKQMIESYSSNRYVGTAHSYIY